MKSGHQVYGACFVPEAIYTIWHY